MNSANSRAPIPRDYVRILRDQATLEAWEAIVVRAIQDAKAGDSKARLWIERHVLGPHPLTFQDLAVREAMGVDSDHEIQAIVDETQNPPGQELLKTLPGGMRETLLQRAARLARADAADSSSDLP